MNDFDDFEAPSRVAFESQSFGIYPRVSSLAQSKEDKSSLDAQVEACQLYGEALGMVLDPACVKKEAHTATTLDRPQLKALLRLMKERKVRNLVIDRADRLTRQGMLPAASLLTQFTQAGILLHVVSMDMTVKNEYQVMLFLQMAFAAQQANAARVQAIKRAKNKNARNGRFLRGNRAPYGFLYEPIEVDDKGRPTKIAFVPDMREVGGVRAWEMRRRICDLYLGGMSSRLIAAKLTEEGVPTSRALAGQKTAQAYWHPSTIRLILRDPLNVGIARTIRSKTQDAPPDKHHEDTWAQQVRLPVEEQIEVPGIVVPPFLLTEAEAAEIERRYANAPRFLPINPRHTPALLRGGVARCGQIMNDGTVCGAAMRVKYYKKGGKPRYSCQRHEFEPARCPGVSIMAKLLDNHAWMGVLEKLLEPGTLEALAREQAALDTSENPTSRLSQLTKTRDALRAKRANIVDSLALADDVDTRVALLARSKEFGEMIAEAERNLEAYTRLAADWDAKMAILRNVAHQMKRYSKHVLALKADNPDDAPYIRTIILSLGVRPIVSQVDGKYTVVIEYNLGEGTAKPWFPPAALEGVASLANWS
jgi:DNA invertase Pin-like site-specific DNA recombinase